MTEERPLKEFMGHRSGWFVNEDGWVFFDANWPHKPHPLNEPDLEQKPRVRRGKRASRRCGATLESGQRCAGPYDCPEH